MTKLKFKIIMPIALFVGRFQPLHKGHVKVIKDLVKQFEKVIIAIGSIQEKRTEKNPFSFYERKKMLELVFKQEISSGKIEIIGVRDENNDQKWTSKILKRVKFDIVVTGNPWVAECFKNKKPVKIIKLWKPEKYSGTIIRKMIRKNKEWKKLVPKEIVSYIEKIINSKKLFS